ncbi:MAG: hypothetical protein ABS960_05550 [Solibacillus isronensis]
MQQIKITGFELIRAEHTKSFELFFTRRLSNAVELPVISFLIFKFYK